MPTPQELPALPKPAVYMHKDGSETWHNAPNYVNGPVGLWNSSQMQEYARTALARQPANTPPPAAEKWEKTGAPGYVKSSVTGAVKPMEPAP